MCFHNKPTYHIPELIEALKAHRLPHDTPSQLADSFRIGWMACASHGQAPAPAQPDKPIACSYGDNGYACCEGGPCQADVHNDKLAEQQAPAGAAPECLTCNDHGAVGNILTAEPCPDCTRWNVQPAQADSVQEDAARYRWLREGNDAKHGAAWHVAVNLYGCEWDAAIDAARKQGEKQ